MAVYDDSTNERPRNAFAEHLTRPFKRAVDILRNRANDLTVQLNTPAFLDQYPAKTVPYVISKLYGPFGLVAARRNTLANGHELLAPVVNLGTFILPRNGNFFVNRDGPFYLCSTHVSAFASLTYASDPGIAVSTVFGGATAGDIFDSVIDANGGAAALDFHYGNFGSVTPAPTICFDIELYDRKRQRRIHDDKLPLQVLSAGTYANKSLASPTRFDPNTEIEPRVRLLEVRMANLLDTDQAFNAAIFRGYISIAFKGYRVLEGV